LHDIHAASSSAGPRTGGLPSNDVSATPAYGQAPTIAAPEPRHETAEEEKRRLATAYSQQQYVPPAGPPPSHPGPSSNAPSQTPQYESAEDEKKRLEREERERILRSGGNSQNAPPKDNKDDELPPYQEPGLH